MLGFTFSVWGVSVGCVVGGDILCNLCRKKGYIVKNKLYSQRIQVEYVPRVRFQQTINKN